MSRLENVTLPDLQNFWNSMQLPSDIRFTVKFEEPAKIQKALKRQRALAAMAKLRGSGNGKLVDALFAEREREAKL